MGMGPAFAYRRTDLMRKTPISKAAWSFMIRGTLITMAVRGPRSCRLILDDVSPYLASGVKVMFRDDRRQGPGRKARYWPARLRGDRQGASPAGLDRLPSPSLHAGAGFSRNQICRALA